jgi:hypothetical protein
MSSANSSQPVQVNCYSGCQFADRPASFTWRGTTYEVAAIEKEWLEPGERHFLVRTKGAKRFEICYHTQEDLWLLQER